MDYKRFVRALCGMLSAVFIVACGGGTSLGPIPVRVDLAGCERGQLPAGEHLLCVNTTQLKLEGDFELVDGYLSASPKVMQSVGDAPASAEFTWQAGQEGYYEVYAWWPHTDLRGSVAEISVEHLLGQEAAIRDQSVYGGQWNSLGAFAFAPSTPARIVFRKVGAAQLIVDAVRFRFVGELPPDPVVETTALPIGQVGQTYKAVLQVSGGMAPLYFKISHGALPAGLQFKSDSGEISGVPTDPGDHGITFTVTDSRGVTADRMLTLRVMAGEPPSPPVPELEDPSGVGDLSDLQAIASGMVRGEWRQVSLNKFSDAWTPAELRPLFGAGNPDPSKIIQAWSSFAWDSNRGNLIVYGGGHANYSGNEVYIWRGESRKWTRGSLPSEVVSVNGSSWNPIDGAEYGPASAHTYDNNVFLPILDRFLTFGGAAQHNGGHYLLYDPDIGLRKTGPYLFDPARAHPWKVGGTTGSHVTRVASHPEVVGGNMWSNRESFLNISRPPEASFTNACTAYSEEGGMDVVYVYLESTGVYRYLISDLNDPTLDTWTKVGTYWSGPGTQTVCAFDSISRAFVRIGSSGSPYAPFVYWDLNIPDEGNRDILLVPNDPGGRFRSMLDSGVNIKDCGFDFDPVRRKFVLWCGGGDVWMLIPPAVLAPDGWEIIKQESASDSVPSGDLGTGILGKWKYIPHLDVFMALEDSSHGKIWIYRP